MTILKGRFERTIIELSRRFFLVEEGLLLFKENISMVTKEGEQVIYSENER